MPFRFLANNVFTFFSNRFCGRATFEQSQKNRKKTRNWLFNFNVVVRSIFCDFTNSFRAVSNTCSWKCKVDYANSSFVMYFHIYCAFPFVIPFFFYRFFYDVSSSPAYELTYIVMCFAIFSVIFGAVAVDTLYSSSIIILCSHFKIIQKRFKALTQDDLKTGARKSLFKIIEYHIFILDLCQCFKDFFEPIILAQFLLSSLLLCVLGFQLTMVSDL
jgi:hypothetical protein